MSKLSSGKYAKAISDRSGMEFPYQEMVKEWNGSFVHVSEFEAKQPQLEPSRYTGNPPDRDWETPYLIYLILLLHIFH